MHAANSFAAVKVQIFLGHLLSWRISKSEGCFYYDTYKSFFYVFLHFKSLAEKFLAGIELGLYKCEIIGTPTNIDLMLIDIMNH